MRIRKKPVPTEPQESRLMVTAVMPLMSSFTPPEEGAEPIPVFVLEAAGVDADGGRASTILFFSPEVAVRVAMAMLSETERYSLSLMDVSPEELKSVLGKLQEPGASPLTTPVKGGYL